MEVIRGRGHQVFRKDYSVQVVSVAVLSCGLFATCRVTDKTTRRPSNSGAHQFYSGAILCKGGNMMDTAMVKAAAID